MMHRHRVRNVFQSFSLLTTKRFGIFWFGSLLSNLGTWMQQVAEPWFVLSLSHSPILLGLDAFAMDAPVWFLSLIGGVLADRGDRRRIIFFFQAVQMLCPVILVIQIVTHQVQISSVILLSFIVGVTDALSMPAFQSIVPSIVKEEEIESGIALNSTQFNLSRVLGPAIAGLVLARFGALGCFALNAFSYVPFLCVILWVVPPKIRPGVKVQKSASEPWYHELRLIGKDRTLRGGLSIVLITSFFCVPLISFVPILIQDIFHLDVNHFGKAISAFGVGGLLGAFVMLSKISQGRKIASISAFVCSLALIASALMSSWWGLLFVLVIAGASLTMTNTGINSILQKQSHERMRGQVASLFILAMRGGMSLGSLWMGFSVHFFGISRALILNGLGALLIQIPLYWSWARVKK